MAGLTYLADANVLSEPTRARPNPHLLHLLLEHANQLATAAPVLHEIVYGVLRLPRSRRRDLLQQHIDRVIRTLPILPYDSAAAEWHAAERVRLAAIGRTPPFVDGQIAAVAHTNGLILITSNVADFRDFDRLVVEDWSA